MMTASDAVKAVRDRAAEAAVKNRNIRRFSEAASPGENIRQGDIYITVLDGLPVGAKPTATRLQLAEGNTQGSRHILDSGDGVTMYEAPSPNGMASYLAGPVMVLVKERVVTHPEHIHVALPPGCYRVTYQRSLDRDEQEIRARD